jgi:hypothetical protein
VRKLLDDPPDEDQLQEIGNMIHLTTDTLFNIFTSSDHDERFQNGFGVDMVSHGRYFHPVVHTARRNEVLLASNAWVGPTPTFHGLPYSYALLSAHARSHDWDHDTRTDEQKYLIPSSTIQLQWKAKSGDK